MTTKVMTVEQLNVTLEEKLAQLKTAPGADRETAQRLAAEMNEVIYSLIYTHAPLVNAVVASIRADVARNVTHLPNRDGDRPRFMYFQEAVTGTEWLSGVREYSFKLHLPYEFRTGRHGSEERSRAFSSVTSLGFENALRGREVPAAFFVELMGGLGGCLTPAYFLPEELVSIAAAQVPDDEFSPYLNPTRSKTPLIKSESALAHYLDFRGFVSSSQGMLINPQYDSRLSTFAAVQTKNEGWVLLEFKDEDAKKLFLKGFSVLTRNLGDLEMAAVQGFANYNASIENKYRGNAAIARLHVMPVMRSF